MAWRELFAQTAGYTNVGAANTAYGAINAQSGMTITAAFSANAWAKGISSHSGFC